MSDVLNENIFFFSEKKEAEEAAREAEMLGTSTDSTLPESGPAFVAESKISRAINL